ncbi:hypothetical protein LB534_14820 [Mesorhizobium sp. CA18]|uniref:hypothetical protein n=1 Tax=unclassified Mesorhizobium TaxID=325217 RepID=UPI001CC9FA2A|nr:MULTISPECIES: hypothetical protein [unclassified Mesorhizobium]MBZ9737170.1 hypothetical protein [Mesorhizobium sp. CA9]MBZ9826558.1 hypothetical protein [Mesorhizobium sp. CA18]MBZ9830785.1 hypothetical protein [Mesorhizobium sp. CA2]MBZ9835539.1 hypothetical protein [Mesorhizobium sp. CA3]MBZ9875777.1 hypothetical protein [Mesorhizobium sp. Ca11]
MGYRLLTLVIPDIVVFDCHCSSVPGSPPTSRMTVARPWLVAALPRVSLQVKTVRAERVSVATRLWQNSLMDIEETKARLEKAVTLFVDDQKQLLELDVNERALGATLAHLFVRECFPDHKVDAEYNRVGLDGSPKRLNLPLECGGENTPVYPDIVVHHRGVNEENLLVVEIKKTTNKQSRRCDLIKLEAYRDQLHYQLGAFLELPAGDDVGRIDPRIHWFA